MHHICVSSLSEIMHETNKQDANIAQVQQMLSQLLL